MSWLSHTALYVIATPLIVEREAIQSDIYTNRLFGPFVP
jgi:hypothetical protein